jgi:uncharacterized protein YcaQ
VLEERASYAAWVLEKVRRRGPLAAAGRRSDFSRLYDLTERLIPAEHRSRRVEHGEARRALLLQAARAHAVGTAKDLADYFRMPVAEARPRLRVLGKWFEGRKTAAIAAALSAELRVLEDWLV